MKNEVNYINDLFVQEDDVLKNIITGLDERELPQISVSPEVGKVLYMLAKISGATHALEIGGLGGYSTIWIGRALPETGEILSLELKQEHVDFALENVKAAGMEDRISYLVGDAVESLDQLTTEGKKFNFFFIDADKPNYMFYLEKAIQLAMPGALIVADNLFQGGRIFDEEDDNPSPVAIRAFNEKIAVDPRLESTILTVGDGLGICRVKSV
ncbi:O-methyltransferase [Hazenella sp. IB182353]|uniref:O-methyltransferase n=1 Tax=Polycladospora coralii TaxID=2771432 RepID=UPI001745ED64|nr:O-methyltransferase [Polycladospora coralii]MBS7530146.1 O-methyltransferase [Polycladospora coralii]